MFGKNKNQKDAAGRPGAQTISGSDAAAKSGKASNNAYYSNIAKTSNGAQADEGDGGDMKPDIHQSLGSKKV